MDIMAKQLVSQPTQQAFRETLVGFVLREIRDFFDAACVPLGELPPSHDINGERRTLVEEYYAGVDWTSWADVKRVIAAYETILIELSTRSTDPLRGQEWMRTDFAKLLRLLRRDGFIWKNDRLIPEHGAKLLLPKVSGSEYFDDTTLNEHLRRIEDGILQDPGLAIGSAKELVETVSKMVLDHYGEPTEKSRENLPQLVGRALDCLDLKAEKITDGARAASASRRVLGSLAGIAGGMAEIRNSFGTGHGRRTATGVPARYAHLMVGASATLCHFMMATYKDKLPRES